MQKSINSVKTHNPSCKDAPLLLKGEGARGMRSLKKGNTLSISLFPPLVRMDAILKLLLLEHFT